MAQNIDQTQQILFILVLLTFGLGGLIAAKIAFTLILIFAAFFVYLRSGKKSYWMVNGFLVSFVIFGAMATMANIQAALGLSFMSPLKIIFIFFGMVLVFVEAGDIIDNQMVQTQMKDP